MKKVLYINDYAIGKSYIDLCRNAEYPSHHLWGIDVLCENFTIKYARVNKSRKFPRLKLLINNVIFFFKNINVDIVYSALPGYSLLFLIAKKLHIKNYKILTIVHHPNSRILFPKIYDKMIFICPFAYEKYKSYTNSEYIFWGGDLNFYDKWKLKKEIKQFNFISAGKTYRDYSLLEKVMNKLRVSYRIFGNKNSTINEISYTDLMGYYNKSQYVVIPVIKNINNQGQILCGLTSFVDAVMLGIPILMSDNTLIGVDLEKENMGYIYHAGDELDLQNKINQMLNLSDTEYSKMSKACIQFGHKNSYSNFCKRLLDIFKEI